MTGRHFIKIIIPALSIAHAGEDGCRVDLTAKAPCGQDLREHLEGAATDEMKILEEDSDSEVKSVVQDEEDYDPLPEIPQKPHSMKRKIPAEVTSPVKSQVSPLAEDDLGED